MKLHREGICFLFIYLVISLIVSFFCFNITYGIYICIPIWLLFIFILWFFRDPKRYIGEYLDNQVISPADGQIVYVKKVYENEFINDFSIMISIFMSPLNVHINRYPVNGTVVYNKYNKGKFFFAFKDKSSFLNEHTSIGIKLNNSNCKILFRQIAGAVARRIVCYASEEQYVTAGAECGFIKFGSRVDLFLPLNSNILVRVGDKVKGGVDSIAEII